MESRNVAAGKLSLDDCATQRNLNERGVAEARRQAAIVAELGIPAGKVTRAAIAARATTSAGSRRRHAERRADAGAQRREGEGVARAPRDAAAPGTNTFFFAHGGILWQATDYDSEEAETFVFKPGDPPTLVAAIKMRDWDALAAQRGPCCAPRRLLGRRPRAEGMSADSTRAERRAASTSRGVSPQTTLLEWLREHAAAHRHQGRLRRRRLRRVHGRARRARRRRALAWKPINACIRLLPSLDGKAVFTVESLQAPDGALHPVQQALVECHGSQCGFCTPGFAMSLFGLYKNAQRPSRARRSRTRCPATCAAAPATGRSSTPRSACARSTRSCGATGWRGPGVAADGSRARSSRRGAARGAARVARARRDVRLRGAGPALARAGRRGLAGACCVAHPDARIVAGATDVGLWITKQHRDLGTMIYTRRRRATSRAFATTTTHASRSARRHRSTDAFEALDATTRSCTRRGCASRRRRSATPARSAATSPTARRSATRCRR